jgi:hypothetical protein
MTDTFGLAELLADGPELARDWRNGWRPGGHPRGMRRLIHCAAACCLFSVAFALPSSD